MSVNEDCEQCIKHSRRCNNDLDGAVEHENRPSRRELERRPQKCRQCLRAIAGCERTPGEENCKRCMTKGLNCTDNLEGIRFREDFR